MAVAEIDGYRTQINLEKLDGDLSPRNIIESLELDKPIYEKTAEWGHFGNGFKWDEKRELRGFPVEVDWPTKYPYGKLNIKCKYIILSYNNEGIIPALDFSKLLKQFGTVELAFKEYNTFRASRNLRFRPLKTKEYLWILHKGMFYKNEVHLQESLQKAQIL